MKSKYPNYLTMVLPIRFMITHDQTSEALLNLKNIEQFQLTLLAQYRDLIQEAILECETEHKTSLNLGKLNFKLKLIEKAALYDGLTENSIGQLIDEALPCNKAA